MRTSTSVSIDAHTLGCRQTGNEVYIRNLISELSYLTSGVTCKIFCSTRAGFIQVPTGFSYQEVSRNPLFRLGWDIPRWVHRRHADVLHVQYTAPIRTPVPVVVTVHDVSFLEEPDYVHPLRGIQLRYTVGRTVAYAARVITPSEHSRRAVLKHYALDPAKVVTISNGVSDSFQPTLRTSERDVSRRWIARKFGIGAPFVLAVGNIEVRKNSMGLLRAFEALIHKRPDLPHHLVFAGQERWGGGDVRRAAARGSVADRVHFTGYVEEGDLRELYTACQLFVFPSFYEGFGLPILEAMACGRAVACSNTTSMPEVAGDAALYFDPHARDDMVSAMEALLTGEGERRHFEQAGVERARAFSWSRSARMTLKVYHAAARLNQPANRRDTQDAHRTLLSTSAR